MTILAVRYNNPGNVSLPITGWTGGGTIVGAPGQPGYASFPSMAIGYAAFQLRLALYIKAGKTTIAAIGATYATDPHWPVSVAAIAGLDVNAKLDPNNVVQMALLDGAIIKQETGMTFAELGIVPIKPAQPAPQPKEPSMFGLPTIVQWIIAILPGIPDDVSLVEAELKELASTDSGVQKLTAALAFGKTLIAKIEAVLGV